MTDISRDYINSREGAAADAHPLGCISGRSVGLRHAAIEHRRRSLYENRYNIRLDGSERLIAREACQRDCIHPDHQRRVPVVVQRVGPALPLQPPLEQSQPTAAPELGRMGFAFSESDEPEHDDDLGLA